MSSAKRQYQALVKIHYDLFRRLDDSRDAAVQAKIDLPENRNREVVLPSTDDLYRMFDRFNTECFNGRLPGVKISYSDRMLIAGSFTPATREIKIGRKYHNIFPDDIQDTLKHEMIHLIYARHDRGFKAMAARLGVSLRARTHPDLRGPHKYLYICPACGREYPRRKRFRMASCGVCSKENKFDPRFKLRPVKAP